jgi:hypothetical protein
MNRIGYSSGEYAVWTQVTTGSEAAGTLRLYNSDQVLQETLNFAGSYTQSQFVLSDDGTAAHGTSVDFHYLSFFSGQTNFSDNDHVGYTGPQISTDGSAITLTNDLQGEYGSWFGSSTHSINAFTASFDYQASGDADGMAFILQNDPRGAGALGTDFAQNGGTGLGYEGISPSAAVEFNFYGNDPPHVPGTNFATDGSVGSYNPTGDVTLGNGDNIQVVLSYDGNILTETLTDLTNGATYSTSYTGIDLSDIVGSSSAYIGFSAATGLDSSTQTVSNFNFESGDAVYWDGACNNWTAADVWTDGNDNTVSMPNAASNVFIDEEGSYRIAINSADVANFLTITCDGAGADIQDETGGSLTLNGSLTIDAGKFSLIGGALSAASIYIGANGHFVGYGNAVTPLDNDGIVLAHAGTLAVGTVTGAGTLEIDTGATLELTSTSTNTVAFEGATGTLQIDSTGTSSPFSLAGGGEPIPEGDQIYLPNISFNADADSYNAGTGVLTVGDGNGHSVTINVAGGIGDGHFNFSQSGTGTLVTDPVSTPANNQAGSVSVGGPGNDNFVFHPGVGADTIVNFDPTHDTIELDHFANAQTVQQLESLITSDAHGDAVIALGNHDSITVAGVTAAHMQQAAQSGHVLMH